MRLEHLCIRQIDVLIDTWWNVNRLNIKSFYPLGTRFNRYMVECECIKQSSPRYPSNGF